MLNTSLGSSGGAPCITAAQLMFASPLTTPRSTPVPLTGSLLTSSLGLSVSQSQLPQISFSRSSFFDDTSSPDMTSLQALLSSGPDGKNLFLKSIISK